MISKADIENVHLLSPIQQGLFFHSLKNPNASSYFGQQVYELEGNLDIACFQHAWEYAVDRHSVLRSAFVWDGTDKMLQVVFRHVSTPLAVEDWGIVAEGDRVDRLANFLEKDRLQQFDLAKAPLFRLAIKQIGEERYYFIFSQHHLLVDGWSCALILKEVLTQYHALRAGRRLDLASPRPYQDYLDWLEQQEWWRAETFWAPVLQSFQGPTTLPFAHSRTSSGQFDEVEWRLSRLETERVRNFAAQHHLTLNSIVQGAWALLLSSHCNKEDVLFGTTVSIRPPDLEGVEAMVGMFINSLPVRLTIDSAESVVNLLERLQATQIDGQSYGFVSLVQIQGWSGVSRGSSLFDSIIVTENHPINMFENCYNVQEVEANSLKINAAGGFARTHYPLTVHVVSQPQLAVQLVYDECMFSRKAMNALIHQMQTVVNGFVDHPAGRAVASLMISPSDRGQLLKNSRGRYIFRNNRDTLTKKIAGQASTSPDAIALECGVQQLTYRELERRSNQVARYLAQKGVCPEVRVAICMERSLEMVTGLLGILKAGGAYVPMDPTYPMERLAYMLLDSQAPILLTSNKLRNRAPASTTMVIDLDDDWAEIEREDSTALEGRIGEDNLAYVIFTSGSTGLPKGVEITHGGLINYLEWAAKAYEICSDSTVPVLSSIGFDLTVTSLFTPLLQGGRAELFPNSDIESLAKALWSWRQYSCIKLTPSHLRGANYLLYQVGRTQKGMPKCLIVGGEQLFAYDLTPWQMHERSTRLINEYGPTEATVGCVVYEASTLPSNTNQVPIGRPIDNTEVFVLTARGDLAPVGSAGELYLGGICLARGYLNRSAETAEKFVPHPFATAPGARLYCTGDLARWNENGQLEYLGRSDQQVKIRGHRIELTEVELALCAHPGIQSCAVIAWPEEVNSSELKLVAYVVPAHGLLVIAEIKKWLEARLPLYMLPSAFVTIDKLPLTENGKLDRNSLLPPDEKDAPISLEYEPPQTETEKRLTRIWEELLRRDRIGRHDRFFDIGGHSLLMTQLVSRVNSAFETDIPFNIAFDATTVAELAQCIDESKCEKRTHGAQLEIAAGSKTQDISLDRVSGLSEREIDDYLAKCLESPLGDR